MPSAPAHSIDQAARPLLLLVIVGLLAGALSGCEEAPVPVVAVAGSGGFLNAGRLAVEDEILDGGLPPFDTIFLTETTNRAGPAIEAAVSLVETPGLLAVVGHANSVASLAASQIYANHGVVQIAPTSTAQLYSDAGPFNFRVVPPDQAQGEFLAKTLADSLPDGTPIALFYVNDDFGRGLRRAVIERLDPARLPILLDLPHAEGDVQQAHADNLVDPFLASGAGAILWLGRVPMLNVSLQRLHELGEGVPVIAGDPISRAALVTELDPWWVGVRYVDFLDIDGSDELRGFRQRFRERFGSDAGGPEVLTYDAVRLILQAVRAGARSGDEVRRHLEELGVDRPEYVGLSGPITFDENGDVEREYVLLSIRPRSEP